MCFSVEVNANNGGKLYNIFTVCFLTTQCAYLYTINAGKQT